MKVVLSEIKREAKNKMRIPSNNDTCEKYEDWGHLQNRDNGYKVFEKTIETLDPTRQVT